VVECIKFAGIKQKLTVMKQVGTILNIVLIIAVAVLFYLHFSSEKSAPATVLSEVNEPVVMMEDSLAKFMSLDSNIAAKPIKIAYVNNDSLNKNLSMLRDVEDRIAKKEKELQGNIEAKKRSYERNYKNMISDFESKKNQYTIKAPTLTDKQLETEQGKLMELQNEIMQMEQSLQQKMYQFSQEQEQEYMIMKSEEMENYYLKVQSFCQSFAKTLGFDFILIYQSGGSILYSNPNYDISNYVVDAINKEYSQNKPTATK
jgi:outer membrane protein